MHIIRGEINPRQVVYLEETWKLTQEAISHVSVDNWKKYTAHAENLQEDFEKEGLRDSAMQSLIINLEDDSDSSSDETE
ncbi:hypothetical protein JTE90_024394 [Oedothorax gibbosus]|uniref:Uncharacterized protein n=1 Tax=Oedothorax gibbosus TaxID=931172 RepID=A0AAV6TTC9_9ARAC|nr:hypothetical protein JTE90_024394 [Oedothorax gibbosus]